jgi:predicted  nucleic acid-binding Zn-ribbon protein
MNNELKKTLAYERLKVVINSIRNASNGILNKCDENVVLNSEKVKNTLDELIGGSNGIAHVILDENDQLFSSVLVLEAKASVSCIKKIQNLIQSEPNNSYQKPIIVITSNQNKSLMVLVILTKEFQSVDSAKSFPLIYSIEPSTGRRDLLSLTENGLLKVYLKSGSKQHGIPVLFKTGIEEAEDRITIDKCKDSSESGWFIIYYSLFLIHDGNDEFLKKKSTWSSVDIDVIKTILLIHVEGLAKTEVKKKTVIKKTKDNLRKFLDVEEDLVNLFKEKKQTIEDRIANINNGSIEETIKQLKNDESILKKANEKILNEIREIELIIKDGEKLLSLNKVANTTNARFERFITGEERNILEMKIEKKGEKSREAIMVHNENERRAVVDKQIDNLKEDLKQQKESANKNNAKIVEFKQRKLNYENVISRLSINIEQYNEKINNLELLTGNYLLQEKKFKNINAEINQLNVDENYSTLISRFLQIDIICDKNEINSLKNKIEQCANNMGLHKIKINDCRRIIEKNNNSVTELSLLIDKRVSAKDSVEKDIAEANTQIRNLKTEYESYSGLWAIYSYVTSKGEEIQKSIRSWENWRKSKQNELKELESSDEKDIKEKDALESSSEEIRKNMNIYQDNIKIAQNNHNSYIEKLKLTKNDILKKNLNNIKLIAKQQQDNQVAIENIKMSIKNDYDKILRVNNDIVELNKEIEKVNLSKLLNESSMNEIQEKIKKAENSLKVSH